MGRNPNNMKRTATIVAAVVALVGIGFAAPAAYAAVTKPVYAAPGTAQVVFTTFDADSNTAGAEVAFTTAPYANFFGVQVSRKSDFSTTAKRVTSQDINANGFTIEGLTPGVKYYFRAYVTNYEGVRLSPYGGKTSVVTPTE
jgi:hypothetical protein